MSIVGDNIKALRKAMGYTSVFKFATAVGLPEKRVDAWERGTGSPKVDDTLTIANFIGIDFQLLHDTVLSDEQIKNIANSHVVPKKKQSPDSNEVIHLKEMIAELRERITDKEKHLADKEKIIELLSKGKKFDGVQHN